MCWTWQELGTANTTIANLRENFRLSLGEDARKAESDYNKKQEMKRWVTEKLYHDDYKRTNERMEDMNYSAMLVNVDAIRGP